MLNLDDIRPRFKSGKVENFEGMALGANYRDKPTLILVSDDNGNDKRDVQSTVFAAFSLGGINEMKPRSSIQRDRRPNMLR